MEVDDFLVLSDSSEDDDEPLCHLLVTDGNEEKDVEEPLRRLVRKKKKKKKIDKVEKVIDPASFSDGIFEDINARHGMNDEEEEEELSVLPAYTMDIWLKEADLVIDDQRPNFPPIPRQKGSVVAANFEKKVLKLEMENPKGVETKRLRRIWEAYIKLRENYYNDSRPVHGEMEILTGSTSNFSDFAHFLDTEAEESDDEEGKGSDRSASHKPKRPRGLPGQGTITGYFNRVGGLPVGGGINSENLLDEYDYEDGFIVRDGEEDEEEEEEEEDPSKMAKEDLSRFREKKRHKLVTENEKMQQEQEELRTLEKVIKQRRKKIEILTTLLDNLKEN